MEEVKKLMKNFDLEDLKKIDLKVFIKILLNSVNLKKIRFILSKNKNSDGAYKRNNEGKILL